jgi:hypothetical protein
MNIEGLESAVAEKSKANSDAARIQALRNQAVLLDICPDCTMPLKPITKNWIAVFLGAGKSKCEGCGKIHKVYYDTDY